MTTDIWCHSPRSLGDLNMCFVVVYDSVLGPGSANFSVQNVQMRHSPEQGMTIKHTQGS